MKLPVEGRITSGFGKRVHPVTGKPNFHNGIDIAVPIGTPIICPADGVVYWLNEDPKIKGGKQLIIRHNGAEYRTGYAHLNKIYVKMGEPVREGQIIAHSGNTGIGTGAHLHFTYTDANGIKKNPLKYFDL